MTKRELIEALKDFDDDTPIYYSTGSSMDDTWGSQYEVDKVYGDDMTFGLLLPKDKQTRVYVAVLEGA